MLLPRHTSPGACRACLPRSRAGCQPSHHPCYQGAPDPGRGRLWHGLTVLHAWCALLCDAQSTTSAQASRGRPRCALTPIQPFSRAIVAAQRTCTPRSVGGRSRSSRTVGAHAAPLLGGEAGRRAADAPTLQPGSARSPGSSRGPPPRPQPPEHARAPHAVPPLACLPTGRCCGEPQRPGPLGEASPDGHHWR
jgi:hypothetical protein